MWISQKLKLPKLIKMYWNRSSNNFKSTFRNFTQKVLVHGKLSKSDIVVHKESPVWPLEQNFLITHVVEAGLRNGDRSIPFLWRVNQINTYVFGNNWRSTGSCLRKLIVNPFSSTPIARTNSTLSLIVLKLVFWLNFLSPRCEGNGIFWVWMESEDLAVPYNLICEIACW